MFNRLPRHAALAALLALPLTLGVAAPRTGGNHANRRGGPGGLLLGIEAVFGALRGVTSSVPAMPAGKKRRRTTRWSAPARPVTPNRCK